MACRTVGLLACWLVGLLACWMVARLDDWMVEWYGWLTCWIDVNRMVNGKLFGEQDGSMARQVNSYGYMNGCFNHQNIR